MFGKVKELSRTVLQRIVARIGERAGVGAYPHRLRHTFTLQHHKLGGDPFSLQQILGHEDLTTVREYVKVAARDVKDLYRSPLDALEVRSGTCRNMLPWKVLMTPTILCLVADWPGETRRQLIENQLRYFMGSQDPWAILRKGDCQFCILLL